MQPRFDPSSQTKAQPILYQLLAAFLLQGLNLFIFAISTLFN
jgi:hypothetical protein